MCHLSVSLERVIGIYLFFSTQFAMEVTQYLTKLCDTEEVAIFQDRINRIKEKQLHFPENTIPDSTIVSKLQSRAGFIAIYDKYLNKGAEWEVPLKAGTLNAKLNLYRRLKMIQVKKSSHLDLERVKSVSESAQKNEKIQKSRASTPKILKSLTPRNLSQRQFSTDSGMDTMDESEVIDEEMPRLRAEGSNTKRVVNVSLLDTMALATDDVVDKLNSSFEEYQLTNVCTLCTLSMNSIYLNSYSN